MFFKQLQTLSYMSAVLVLCGLLVGCKSPTPPPRRGFTTADLLISPNLIPPDWKVESGPTDYPFNALGFRNNLGGSTIEFRNTDTNVDHIVALFSDAQDAAKAFRDHDYTRNTQGYYGSTWEPFANLTYESWIANQYLVMCGNNRNVTVVGVSCVVEAQYEEFLSIILYYSLTPEKVSSDLEMLAKAVDVQMDKYLNEAGNK